MTEIISVQFKKEYFMKRYVVVVMGILFISGMAEAKKNCTDQPQDKWMSEKDFKAKIEGQGYKINKFKQPGTCYEIYGLNKDGKKVEIYFNPVDATIVKEEID
jgi:hypothetical protein